MTKNKEITKRIKSQQEKDFDKYVGLLLKKFEIEHSDKLIQFKNGKYYFFGFEIIISSKL